MKKLFLIGFITFATPCFANVFIITAPDHSVYTVSEKDDTAVPSGYGKASIPGKLSDLQIANSACDYKYINGNFSINQDKIAAKQAIIQAESDAATAKASAVAKLKTLGLTDAEIAAMGK